MKLYIEKTEKLTSSPMEGIDYLMTLFDKDILKDVPVYKRRKLLGRVLLSANVEEIIEDQLKFFVNGELN